MIIVYVKKLRFQTPERVWTFRRTVSCPFWESNHDFSVVQPVLPSLY